MSTSDNRPARWAAFTALIISLFMLGSVIITPEVWADDGETEATVVASARRFPKQSISRANLLSESVATTVDGSWGEAEKLEIPQTQSQAEKDAATAQAQAQQQATDTPVQSTVPVNPPDEKTASALVQYALQFQGYPYAAGGNTPAGWDCSGFTQYVYAQFGISLPHPSGSQMSVGVAVPSLADARPGDILANGSHAAIYIGNGMVVNALNPSMGTQVTGVGVFYGGYAIRRVL